MSTRVALLFPPQWDPRQPPLCMPTLAGVLQSQGHVVRAWDLNLQLYRHLLLSASSRGQREEFLKPYLEPSNLEDASCFMRLSSALEQMIGSRNDGSGLEKLLWDGCNGYPSADCSKNWRMALSSPEKVPFFSRSWEILNEIACWQPEIVGISAICDTQVISALALASAIRKKLPEARIILGGHGFACRRSHYEKIPWLFKAVDGICILDGEPSLLEIAAGRPLDEVPNLVTFDGNAIRQPKTIKGFDEHASVEADFSVLRLDEYLSPLLVIPVATARGCPWYHCIFCSHARRSLPPTKRYSERPLVAVKRELEEYFKRGFRHFCFVDETVPVERFLRIAEMIRSISGSIAWICYVRLDRGFTYEVFRTAREAGCRKIFCGLETGSGRLLKWLRKGVRPPVAKEVICDASKAGIAVHLFLMESFPGESREDLGLTSDFLKDILHSVDHFGFSYDVFPFSIMMDTDVYENPQKFGILEVKNTRSADLAWCFKPVSARSVPFCTARGRIEKTIERHCEGSTGLRQFGLTQDSLHLLLLEARKATVAT
jgi:radical SAM superfamily enzyme YgiQ (UPF0313 family)